MKKYSAPKAELTVLSCCDVLTISFQSSGEGDKISWDEFGLGENPSL